MLVRGGDALSRPAVVLTTGTFLKALMHTGEVKTPGGRAGEGRRGAQRCARAARLSAGALQDRHALPAQRPDDRLLARPRCSPATRTRSRFRFSPTGSTSPQVACRITHTNEAVHELIRANLHRAPMYSGQIQSRGPRYCPSIEDKVVRFADKERHQMFLEPEGRNTREFYFNGISTSLPATCRTRCCG